MESWDQEIVISFIECYKKHNILWDPKNPHYFNKLIRQDAWEEISEEMGKPVEECKKKLDYLLAALRREKMKINNNKSTGKDADEVYRSSWFAFDSLKFLWDKNKTKTTLNTLPNATNIQDKTITEVVDGNPIISRASTSNETSEVNPDTSRTIKRLKPPTPSHSKRKQQNLDQQRLEKAFEIRQNSTNAVDDSHHFGNMVASKLRTYDEYARCAIQRDIMNIFLRASTRYSNTTQFPYSSSPADSDLLADSDW